MSDTVAAPSTLPVSASPAGGAPRVAVLGGGLAGLAAAYRLLQREPDWNLALFEASPRLGGKIVTERGEGFTWEDGPDSIACNKPEALALVRELGLSGDLVAAHIPRIPVYIYSEGRLHPLPGGMSFFRSPRIAPLLAGRLLSPGAKLRLAASGFVPAAAPGRDESLGEFVRRRLGAEAVDKVFEPLFAGLHAAKADELSLDATFPQLRRLERGRRRAHGPSRAAEPAAFMTLRKGLSSLVEALGARLPAGAARLNCPVEGVSRAGRMWRVRTAAGVFEADAVIAALPSSAAAAVLSGWDSALAASLGRARFASSAAVSLAYAGADFPGTLDAMGMLLPRREGKAVFAASFISTKFPSRVPAGSVAIRCFLGGSGGMDVRSASDAELVEAARRDVADVLGLGPVRPKAARVRRWIDAHPIYEPGHAKRLEHLDFSLRRSPGLFLAGSSYHGISLSDCAASGQRAAALVRAFINTATRG